MAEIGTPPAPPAAPSNAAEASARLATLTADDGWRSKFFSGDVATAEEWKNLTTLVATGTGVDAAMAGVMPSSANGILPDANQNLMTQSAAWLRECGLSDGTIRQLLNDETVSAEEHAAAKQWRLEFLSDRERTAKWRAGDAALRKQVLAADIIINSEIRAA